MRKKLLLFSCLAVLILGCASAKEYVLYDGPRLPKEKVAILYAPTNTNVRLFVVNDRKASGINGFGSEWGDAFIMELLPGAYDLAVGYREVYGVMIISSNKNQTVSFRAEAGHIYLLTAESRKSIEGFWSIPQVLDVTPDHEKKEEYSF
ncbi:MAG: hypothetical protein C4538_02010 [Nitrospiraceae bacterium]|nr:MAG: hypothetical protein C4538_02010 [Nitrospiraceae bacterium]